MTFISMAEGQVLLLDHFEGQWKVKLIFQAKSPPKKVQNDSSKRGVFYQYLRNFQFAWIKLEIESAFIGPNPSKGHSFWSERAY